MWNFKIFPGVTPPDPHFKGGGKEGRREVREGMKGEEREGKGKGGERGGDGGGEELVPTTFQTKVTPLVSF